MDTRSLLHAAILMRRRLSDVRVRELFREDRELRAAEDRLKNFGIHHVIFGHTHVILNAALDGALFNSGTWMPHLLNSETTKEKVEQQGIMLVMLADMSLYVVDRLAVHILCEAGREPQLMMVEHTQ